MTNSCRLSAFALRHRPRRTGVSRRGVMLIDGGAKLISSSRLLCFLALLALMGVGGCSASGPEPWFETAYSAIGAQVK
jgi:hypothetical protein